VSELAGRGIGMDVVRAEVQALGGRVQTQTQRGQGSTFQLILPLTTAVTQVVMLRSGSLSIGVPSNVVEIVRRATTKELEAAYANGTYRFADEDVPFYWAGALLQHSNRSAEPIGRSTPVVVFRSAGQRIAMHVDEVLGNQEVVVKNLGQQLARLPGLTGMSVLASGLVVLIYNPVALAAVYGTQARSHGSLPAALAPSQVDEPKPAEPGSAEAPGAEAEPAVDANRTLHGFAVPKPSRPKAEVPLVMVVDDSITVRRVTQRLLAREGYRVVLAADGLQALEKLQDEIPAVVLSDIEMPRMDGFDLARNIRMDNDFYNIPIIMITSRIAEKHKEHADELGVNHYLGKPYNEDELLSLVRRYCFDEVPAA
jgi:chemosensory pili system protein ChpA (sensor histidine kinase/response regulator)